MQNTTPYFTQYAPSPWLADYVDSYWVLEDTVMGQQEFIDKILPTVKYGMVFHYGQPTYGKHDHQKEFVLHPNGLFASKINRPLLVKSSLGRKIFGVKLKPHTTYAVLGIPAIQVTNHTLAIDTLFGASGNELTERMQNARDTQDRIRIIESFLAFRLGKGKYKTSDTVRFAVDRIRQHLGDISMKSLADDACVSERQMQRLFLQHVGVSPKFFARTVRINYVFDLLRINNSLQWQDIVFECGYFDQSHFIKEFKEFSNETPDAFFRKQSLMSAIFQGQVVDEEVSLLQNFA
ncbi:helix-turn-helix domain-containing protein [Cytophagales bacterium LB-30]|uniref:Helix-turn-helix domain-containing protein n=1 Tax=Shiella aurantiaca TaxID=3058365 RepID=A0ABT8F1C8_9BACT|nr:helix-turn-helix domain-containing protein [Shiella aurantiaca]MDN4164198.1 helix-turn-helix domain-containing protein [Shiella aurantiaca]